MAEVTAVQKCAKLVDPPKSCKLNILGSIYSHKFGIDIAENEPSKISLEVKNLGLGSKWQRQVAYRITHFGSDRT